MTQDYEIAQLARTWIGTPYRHQASIQGVGADCLGLVRGLWRTMFGNEPCTVPTYSNDWGEWSGDELLQRAADKWLVSFDGEQPPIGSVLLFRMSKKAIAKHLGILVDAGINPSFVHAYSGYGVVESPLSEPWSRRVVAAYTFPRKN